jgi:hypothetical protein
MKYSFDCRSIARSADRLRPASRRVSRIALLSVIAGLWLTGPSAFAQSAAQIQQLQEQIKQLQTQLDAVKKQQAADEQKVTVSAAQAAQASAQASQAAAQVQSDSDLMVKKSPNGGIQVGGVNFKLGGFTEFATIYRSRNDTSDVGSDLNGIPFNNTAKSQESELRFSGRQSRISGLISGDPDADTHLTAYAEADFLGTSDVSNSRESNSYLLRMRNFYGALDKDDWGLHVLAGQNWSLLTTNTQGILPRSEQVPLTIDAQYNVGFNWARTPQFRVVEDFGNGLWGGLSVESPQAIVGGNNPNGTAFANGQTNPNANNTGDATGLFSTSQFYTDEEYPDIIAKVAYDLPFAHLEAKGIERMFTDRYNGRNKDSIGGGGGGAATFHVIPNGGLDIQASALAGYGIGRYGSGQINDVSFNSTGGLNPTPEVEALLGLIASPRPGTQAYLYAGIESTDSTATKTNAGWGAGNIVNTGCQVFGGTCNALTRRLEELQGGVWQDLYKGSYGRFTVGASGAIDKKYTFEGVGGAPNTDEIIFMTSVRYYPF